MQGRKTRLAKNTVSSLIFQLTTIICGFILPRIILKSYGSEVNGLVNSVTQFLSMISFLELGVGAVVQSALYGPLAEKNSELVSKIVVSAGRFFKRIAEILFVYIIVLIFIYPIIAKQKFGWSYTAALILAMSISSFAQYYFGVIDRLLLTADQRGYIQYTAQTITLIANTAVCTVLINLGASIHFVKLTTSLIYLLRPAFLRWYVSRNYSINRRITYDAEPIAQKWNGVAQHIAAVVLDSTDSIILTVFSSLSDVSIYSVYHLVVFGVKQLFLSMSKGIEALIGEIWAKQEWEELEKVFSWTEWSIHTGTIFIFGCTASLIVPFVRVYTLGVDDADYIQPLFAVLIVLAHAGHCLRLPYHLMIHAGGHYKQTQNSYILSAVINIVISVAAVNAWGLLGVAVGTLSAMAYQTFWMALYNSRHLMKRPFVFFLKQFGVDIGTAVIGWMLCLRFDALVVSYSAWIVLAIKCSAVWVAVVLIMNSIFYRKKVQELCRKTQHLIVRTK